ncbi:MAG: DNA polymerase/3'-5' exonuclease PolX [bacterium]
MSDARPQPIDKTNVARILREIAALLEIRGENPFKARAYENAARAIEGTTEEFGALVASGAYKEIAGIGPALREKLEELAATGRLEYYDALRAELPATILELTAIPGLGPKKIHSLHTKLGIASIEALEAAARDGRLTTLPGFTAKTAAKILEGIEFLRANASRRLLVEGLDEAARVVAALGHVVALPGATAPAGRALPVVTSFAVAGSLRRFKETVKDVDMVGCSDEPEAVMTAFQSLGLAARVVNRGATKSTIVLDSGMQVDLRLVAPEEFAYTLLHFTGSAEHNTAMRARAKERALKLNEYGLWSGEERIPAASEEEIFATLGLAPIAPELREAMGEIEDAEAGAIPRLVTASDLRGVLHCHSTWSDGRNTIAEMAEAARDAGYEYIGMSDHSRTAAYAGGLTPERVRAQWDEIDALNARLAPFRIFKGIESDILGDGALDYDDELLAGFDFVVASVHSRMTMELEEMTARIVRAVEHPRTTILGHPTGRRLLTRDAYAVDMTRVIDAALANHVVVELNCNPERLDIDWRVLRGALPRGLTTSINPDAHATAHFRFLEIGAGVARKARTEARHVLNTRSASEIADYFAERKRRAAR